jgi:hypothetical protein
MLVSGLKRQKSSKVDQHRTNHLEACKRTPHLCLEDEKLEQKTKLALPNLNAQVPQVDFWSAAAAAGEALPPERIHWRMSRNRN